MTKSKEIGEKDEVPTNRVTLRQQRTRLKLIEAIRKLTAEKGVNAVTIRDIATEADIAMGSFYNYFKTKDELLNEALAEIIFQSGEMIDGINAASSNPLVIIATAFATFAEVSKRDPLLGWFMIRMTNYDPSVGATLAERFARDVQKGLASGQFNVPDVHIAMSAAQSALVDFLRQRLLGVVDEDSIVDFIHLVLRMLGANETSARVAAEQGVHLARQHTEEES